VLAWDAGPGDAVWGVGGIAGSGATPTGDGIELRLELANATAPASEGIRAAAAGVIDPMVEVTSTDGVTVALPLSTWGALPPPLETRLVKDGPAANLAAISGIDLTLRSSAEVVVQGYTIPLAAFAAADPAFIPARLDGVVLRISRATTGRLAVAGFGLATGPR
jgi:hypothetical protein